MSSHQNVPVARSHYAPIRVDLDANKGTPSVIGEMFYATDTGKMYISTGVVASTDWVCVAIKPAAKGDIVVGSGDGDLGLLSVGLNDEVVTADAAEVLGLKYAGASGGSGSSISVTSTDASKTTPLAIGNMLFAEDTGKLYIAVGISSVADWKAVAIRPTAKGQVAVGAGDSDLGLLSVGLNDEITKADSTESLGLKYFTPFVGASMSAEGHGGGNNAWDYTTVHTVYWETEDFDDDGSLVDLVNNRFAIQDTGRYHINFAVASGWTIGSDITGFTLRIKNGATTIFSSYRKAHITYGNVTYHIGSHYANLTSGDYITMEIEASYSYGTSSITCYLYNTSTFQIHKVR